MTRLSTRKAVFALTSRPGQRQPRGVAYKRTTGPLFAPAGIATIAAHIQGREDTQLVTATCTECPSAATVDCTQCHARICDDHKIIGQPFISAWQLVTTIVSTALRAPGMLGEILFKELDQVPYCPTCREEIGAWRQTEQLKVAGGMLLVMLLIVGLPVFLFMS